MTSEKDVEELKRKEKQGQWGGLSKRVGAPKFSEPSKQSEPDFKSFVDRKRRDLRADTMKSIQRHVIAALTAGFEGIDIHYVEPKHREEELLVSDVNPWTEEPDFSPKDNEIIERFELAELRRLNIQPHSEPSEKKERSARGWQDIYTEGDAKKDVDTRTFEEKEFQSPGSRFDKLFDDFNSPNTDNDSDSGRCPRCGKSGQSSLCEQCQSEAESTT